jgi:type I restriction enzyme S subunit
LGILKAFEIPLPPVETQRRIAEIASAYDELIENNQRRIKMLEEAARRLYREWFVALRFPGHERVKVVDGVPQGWEQATLGDALQLQRGFDLPSGERKDGNVPIIASNGVTGYHHEARVKAPGVVTGRSGTLGAVHFVQEDFWPLNTSLWVKEFRRVTPLTAYFMLTELGLGQFNSGASVPTLDRKAVHPLPVLLAPQAIQQMFDQIALPSFSQIKVLQAATGSAKQARDALLPRLMSGALAV